jgi:hypothetical protein
MSASSSGVNREGNSSARVQRGHATCVSPLVGGACIVEHFPDDEISPADYQRESLQIQRLGEGGNDAALSK